MRRSCADSSINVLSSSACSLADVVLVGEGLLKAVARGAVALSSDDALLNYSKPTAEVADPGLRSASLLAAEISRAESLFTPHRQATKLRFVNSGAEREVTRADHTIALWSSPNADDNRAQNRAPSSLLDVRTALHSSTDDGSDTPPGGSGFAPPGLCLSTG